MIFRRRRPPPADSAPAVRRVLLASEGREFPDAAVAYAADLARENGASVRVFSVVRVWGTSLGLPNPGLLPTKPEWDAQRAVVTRAVKAVRRRGVEADGHVLATRKATKRIISEALRLGCDAIVMGADPPRNALLADLMWSQEPYRVRRRSPVPVHVVTVER